eukprot:m.586956 g.586956  ORF g.586956 m.586956 type:complete len:72 (-) comp22349_c0_seq4:2234-2449(-)
MQMVIESVIPWPLVVSQLYLFSQLVYDHWKGTATAMYTQRINTHISVACSMCAALRRPRFSALGSAMSANC